MCQILGGHTINMGGGGVNARYNDLDKAVDYEIAESIRNL